MLSKIETYFDGEFWYARGLGEDIFTFHRYGPGYFYAQAVYPDLDIQHFKCQAFHVKIQRGQLFTHKRKQRL